MTQPFPYSVVSLEDAEEAKTHGSLARRAVSFLFAHVLRERGDSAWLRWKKKHGTSK